jgi:hypothetical protein
MVGNVQQNIDQLTNIVTALIYDVGVPQLRAIEIHHILALGRFLLGPGLPFPSLGTFCKLWVAWQHKVG